jgi:hypothetical protein
LVFGSPAGGLVPESGQREKRVYKIYFGYAKRFGHAFLGYSFHK